MQRYRAQIIFNSTTLPSSACLLGILRGVVLSPDDAGLIKGAPTIRRHYLDMQIAQGDPLYVHYLTRFNRAMRQRNCLLRAKNAATIESWEHEMASSAAYITQQRASATHILNEHSHKLHSVLAGDTTHLSLSYKSSQSLLEDTEKLKQRYLEQWNKHRRREMELGCTLSGPHKDDLSIAIDAKEARLFASEGQQRTSAAALRLAEWERLQGLGDERPLMLIDDMGISLDETRRMRLLQHTQGLGQVFLTSTENLPIEGKIIGI